MRSLRLYLIFSILSVMTILIFLSALHGYQSSSNAAKQVLDQQLVGIARMLSSIHFVAQTEHPPQEYPQSSSTAYQIWQQGKLLSRSGPIPDSPIMPFQSGFLDINLNQYRWRCYAMQVTQHDRWLLVAERLDIRNQLVDQMIIDSVLPTVLILPAALVIIWVLVGYGLKPIRQLTHLLQHKQATDLDAVQLDESIDEIAPLVNSINLLLNRLQNALDREQRFSADAAHELRTPLSVLKIYIHNLSCELPAEPASLRHLKAGVERMEHLVEQILALYRTSPDHYAAQWQSIDLYSLAQNVIALRYASFEDKQQQIELDGSTVWLQGDVFALETLLANLLSNASKYAPEQARILVSIVSRPEQVVLCVEDSGPGIPSDQYERIFDRFYRLHGDQHASGTQGCGLGLSIVQHIVELHHGQISLAPSRFPTGLAVSITLPTTASRDLVP